MLQRSLREVDDREAHVWELVRDGVDRVRHQEPDSDHEVEVLLRETGEVRDVVGALLRLEHPPLHPELLLRAQEAHVVQVVERAVVQAADVGDQADLDRLPAARRRRRRGGGGAAAARARRPPATGGEEDEADQSKSRAASHPVHRARLPRRATNPSHTAIFRSPAGIRASRAKKSQESTAPPA